MKKKIIKKIIICLIFIIVIVGFFQTHKNLPDGISYISKPTSISEENIDFLYDLTYEIGEERIYDHEIFEKIYESIDKAQRYILIDMFLWGKNKDESLRDISQEMTDHLVQRKEEVPELEIILITDGYNTGYDSFEVDYFEQMKNVGINVIFTDLNKLRDSNTLYSPFWRTFVQFFGEPSKGWLDIPGYEEKGSIRAFLKLLNFKANHRKTMIVDCGNQMCSFIISANPAGSGAEYSNVGILIKDEIYKDIYASEKAVLDMSGFKLNDWDFSFVKPSLAEKDIELQLITENKIKKTLIEEINNSQSGEEIKISIFFFSDRDIIKALLDASKKDVDIKIITDPSKFAFGRNNFGVPTRMVISELIKKSKGKIEAKYYDTEAEQFHTKMSIFVRKENVSVIVGSANYTRRNLDNFNLESDLKIIIPIDKIISKDILDYFDKMWNNIDGEYTVNVDSFAEPSFWRNIQYRFQEFTGMGTF